MSNSILDDLVSSFDPEGILSVVADNPESLRSTAKTATLIQGRRVPFRASIGGNEYTAFATLRSAHLHRISVIDHISTRKKEGENMSKLVTGIFKPVKMDIEVVVGNETITLQELMRYIANKSATTPVSEERFAATLEDLGFRFTTGMNLFWQQFGSRQDGIDELIEQFQRAGAIDVHHKIEDPRRIKQSFQMPRTNDGVDVLGPEVVSMEIGRSDRSQSLTEQGFLDFVDATTENYKRIVRLRKQADIMRATNAKLAAEENWSTERKQAAAKEVSELVRLSQQWASTWSGAQERILVDQKDPDIKTPQGTYDPTSAPCGRFKMIVNGETVNIDLWTNSLRANTSDSTSVAPASVSTEAPAADEVPVVWAD